MAQNSSVAPNQILNVSGMGSIRGRFGYDQANQEAGLGHQISFVPNVVGKASAHISNPTSQLILSGPFQYILVFIRELI